MTLKDEQMDMWGHIYWLDQMGMVETSDIIFKILVHYNSGRRFKRRRRFRGDTNDS